MKMPAAEAAADKAWEKLEKFFGVELDESQKERGDRRSEDVGRKSSFCIINGHLSFEECKEPKIQRSSCTPRRHCERWFWILCSIYWMKIISITNDSGKSHGYHVQIAWLRRRSSVHRQHVTRFRDVKVRKNLFGYRWIWRSQNTVWLQVHKWTTKSRRKELCFWYCVCVVKPSDKTHDTSDNVTTKNQRCTRDPMCAESSSLVPVVMIRKPHRGSRLKLWASLMSSMHVVSVTLRLWALHSMQLPLFPYSSSVSCSPSCTKSQLWG